MCRYVMEPFPTMALTHGCSYKIPKELKPVFHLAQGQLPDVFYWNMAEQEECIVIQTIATGRQAGRGVCIYAKESLFWGYGAFVFGLFDREPEMNNN